jgi:hypothetical protein
MTLLARGKRVPYSIFKHASSVRGNFILQIRVQQRRRRMHSKILRRYAVVVDKPVTNNIRFFTFCITLKARMMPSRYAESNCHVCMWKFESICCVWRSGTRILLLASVNQRTNALKQTFDCTGITNI